MVSDCSLMSYQGPREMGLMEQCGIRANTRNPHRLLKARVLRGDSILFAKIGGKDFFFLNQVLTAVPWKQRLSLY